MRNASISRALRGTARIEPEIAMLSYQSVQCPYCGEPIELALDASAGEQSYIEDCQVCCRPISVTVILDDDGEPQVNVAGENEA